MIDLIRITDANQKLQVLLKGSYVCPGRQMQLLVLTSKYAPYGQETQTESRQIGLS